MEPPKWVVEEIERIHPRARLGWIGESRIDDDGAFIADSGFFMLIQLYHHRDADYTMHYPWNDCGPIYGSHFDREVWRPMIIFPATPEDVYSGKVIEELSGYMRPVKEQLLEGAKKDDVEYEDKMDELSEEIGEKLWRTAGEGAPVIAKKFIDEAQKAVISGDVDLSAGDSEVDRVLAAFGEGRA